jgi:hypothetical protein
LQAIDLRRGLSHSARRTGRIAFARRLLAALGEMGINIKEVKNGENPWRICGNLWKYLIITQHLHLACRTVTNLPPQVKKPIFPIR